MLLTFKASDDVLVYSLSWELRGVSLQQSPQDALPPVPQVACAAVIDYDSGGFLVLTSFILSYYLEN